MLFNQLQCAVQCPPDTTQYDDIQPDQNDVDFRQSWEFTHMAEAAFKYNLTVAQPSVGPDCNAYVSTSIDRGCVNVSEQRFAQRAACTSEMYHQRSKTARSYSHGSFGAPILHDSCSSLALLLCQISPHCRSRPTHLAALCRTKRAATTATSPSAPSA